MTSFPRIILAGLSGGAGKTFVSAGLARAFSRRGLSARPFKKGPDYIDAAWLSLAARATACNLDPFLLKREVMAALFQEKASGADISIIEGNRGLFDGKDVQGTCSTAELARQLDAPVVLVLDATKMTRTAAAIVAGCRAFEPGLNLAGVILNRTAGERHRNILTQCIEDLAGVPVLGALPKSSENPIPERHMGLVSDQEFAGREEALDAMAATVERWVDVDRVLRLAQAASAPASVAPVPWPSPELSGLGGAEGPVIGYVHDAALWFYYPENLEALERAGARLERLSLLSSADWPEIHGLYLGGGFPETQAAGLSANTAVRGRVRALAQAGLPIYAECGGFMYLCASLSLEDGAHELAGVFPFSTRLCPRPQGLGYVEALVRAENPFHPLGAKITGHEFHYSACMEPGASADPSALAPALALEMLRGRGMMNGCDGLVRGGTFAAYTHIHALGTPHWAPNFVRAAQEYRDR
ncbi:MAG: cobyrinate a,c-diamide synthase [Proteobacteria bacterium]|nr:cobyrinate a,c-diamide synthase [Pseudomonadota bacterium]MBU1594485.1 cobyrinate a,c-diamide synthase [Pseudomonadota bacterium]